MNCDDPAVRGMSPEESFDTVAMGVNKAYAPAVACGVCMRMQVVMDDDMLIIPVLQIP